MRLQVERPSAQRDGRRAALLALSLVVSLAGCDDRSATPDSRGATGARPNVVRATLNADPASLSLIGKTGDRNSEIVAVQLTDSLLQYDSQLELQPRVAESFVLSDDRRTLTFRLRDGVRWHDGRPVTAADVVFTVHAVRDPKTENRTYGPALRTLDSVEVRDARTVVARSREPIGSLEAWRVPLLPRHLAEADDDLITGAFARHPVGCGPFRFVDYRRGEELILEANDDYWDGRPFIDRLILKIYTDRSTALQALLGGQLDILTVSAAQWHEVRDQERDGRLRSFVFQTLSLWPLMWNVRRDNPFFGDPRVRQALVHALDRATFAETVARGQARPGATPFHPDTTWAAPDVAPRAYDPARAAQLLDEAGWRDSDGDGTRDREGRPFRFTLLLPNSSMRLVQQIAVWQQHAWKQIGVEAQIEQMEWQAFRERRNDGRFDAVSFSLSFTPDPDQFFDLYHSTAVDGGFNFGGFADAQVDRLLEEGRRTFEAERKREVYRQLQRRLVELEPITCTFYFASPVLVDRRLEGVVPTPLDFWRTIDGPRRWRWVAEAH